MNRTSRQLLTHEDTDGYVAENTHDNQYVSGEIEDDLENILDMNSVKYNKYTDHHKIDIGANN